MTTESLPHFPKLNTLNYQSWESDMSTFLMKKGYWRIVKNPLPDTKPKDDAPAIALWEDKVDKAAGEILSGIERDLRTSLMKHRDDPHTLWTKIAETCLNKQAGSCYNAYHALFSASKQENETALSLMNRIAQLAEDTRNLRPTTWTITHLDDELETMALLRALPDEEYAHLKANLLLVDNLTKDKVQSAIRTSEVNRAPTGGESALAASFKPRFGQKSRAYPSSSSPTTENRSARFDSRPPRIDNPDRFDHYCPIHNTDSHPFIECNVMQNELKRVVLKSGNASTHLRGKPRANRAQDNADGQEDPEIFEAFDEDAEEFAGSASAFSTSTHLIPDADTDWTPDSGATSHMTPHRHWFSNFRPLTLKIRLADNSFIESAGVGDIEFHPTIDGKKGQPVTLTCVLYVPSLRSNLLSILYLTQKRGIDVNIVKGEMRFSDRDDSDVIFTARVTDDNIAHLNGYTMTNREAVETAKQAVKVNADVTLWHRRFCHLGIDGLNRLVTEELVDGLNISPGKPFSKICEPCIHGKQHRDPFPKQASSRATRPLELVHSDLHGPLPVETKSGYRYWITFTDDYSRNLTVYLLKKKSDTAEAFKKYKAWAEKLTGYKIGTVRDDKGGEWMSLYLAAFMDAAGIERQHTAPGTPQQNGVSERANRTIEERIIAMLKDAQLPPSFWGEALATFVHVHNRCPTSSLTDTTPHESWRGKKPSVEYLRVFGCTAYVHVQKEKRRHLGSHTRKCIFLGYPEGVKAWRFWDPERKTIITSRDAIFDESTRLVTVPRPTPQPTADILLSDYVIDEDTDEDSTETPHANTPAPGGDIPTTPAVEPPTLAPTPPAPPAAPRRSARAPIPVDHGNNWLIPNAAQYRDVPRKTRQEQASDQATGSASGNDGSGVGGDTEVAHLAADIFSHAVSNASIELALRAISPYPRSYAQAMRSPDAKKWEEACVREYNSLIENTTWKLVDLPPGRETIGNRWVLTTKTDADEVELYKARLCAQGYSQRPGVDFNETYSPVALYSSIRTVLAIAAIEDMEIDQVDFTTAFLNGVLEEEIYMRQPEGFVSEDPTKVCLLLRSIYGLKQAGRVWYRMLRDFFHELGFTSSQVDTCVFTFARGKLIITVWVDDQLITCNSRVKLDWIKGEMAKRFKIKDLGPARHILGLEITRDRANRQLFVGQQKYTKEILERFGMSDCKPVSTPMEAGVILSKSMSPKTPQETEQMKNLPYMNVVGAILFLAQGTRPDLSYAASVLGQFNSCPGPQHWRAAQRVLRYLKGTSSYRLRYGPSSSGQILTTFVPKRTSNDELGYHGFTDSDYAGDVDTRRSQSGYVFFIGSGPVSWKSTKQQFTSLSTTESEYAGAVTCGREAVAARQLLADLGYPQNAPTMIYSDNQSAIAVARNPEHQSRMKHIDVRLHWLRDHVEANNLDLTYISTEEMVADIFTKPLPRPKHDYFRSKLGLIA